ncbi:hypothetical protein Vlu01_06470 [Micromonospora lutea]|uniref:MYXO-CTERM domain-containing protein n=1 Tax=Micromonospora lutea TaxID=419825 RepID=A0ABQ4IQ36_9ACTN|nr:hypothetical protein Vlu01_06470 [Micromonospora lutea]
MCAILVRCYLGSVHYVRGHYRNGRWVRPHYRRNGGAAPLISEDAQVRVRRHQRADGTWVRSHYRHRTTTQPDSEDDSNVGFLVAGMLLLVVFLVIVSSQS